MRFVFISFSGFKIAKKGMFKVLATGILMFLIGVKAFPQLIRNMEARYTIRKLKSWEVKTDSSKTVIFEESSKRNDVYSENLQINVYPANGMSLENCFETYFTSNLPLILQGYQPIDTLREVINGQPARVLKFSHKVDESEMVSMVFVMLKNDILYYIFSMAVKDEFDKYENYFLQMINTFRIY